ncbi:helix-turn-helix domain-containing protein [Gordonia sp. WA4-43]|uniref:helix-turn-helix domain-containing protein n=1 Tax=Gordonia sp. WA4-43 TaxID=2878678 RepID=UPI001CF9AB20|nr:helix-turn-helix transcriptional regulator [Gordonia sp. WA4-43]UCZ89865.1 helix-turn-helix domain-containing protein [Gordonia sp. WA4-43]
MTTWSEDLVSRVAGAIKRERERSTPKVTATQLAERTAALGLPISRSVISDLETGRKRSLDVGELIVLAAALRVPPMQLLYPDLPDKHVDIVPGYGTESAKAAAWFAGLTGLSRVPTDFTLTSAVNERRRLMDAQTREVLDALSEDDATWSRIGRQYEERIDELTDLIRRLGGTIYES